MFTQIKNYIKARKARKLFFKIYFGYLRKQSSQNEDLTFVFAMNDFERIQKLTFSDVLETKRE